MVVDGRPVLGRNLVGEVHLARHHGVGQRGDVGNDPIFHRVEIGLAFLEVVGVPLELDRRARLIADELERPDADRLGVQVVAGFDQLLRHDRAARESHVD